MQDAMELFTALCDPFAIEEISWRVGPTNERSRKEGQPLKGQPLCYVDARTVMDRLDSVLGVDGWQCTYTPGVATSIVCNIGIRINGEWTWKADGAGPSDMEADKGALSDAFKRAAVRWGVGRYLYEVKAPWLELEQRGKTAIIRDADHEKLRALHDTYARKAGWGDEQGVQAYRLLRAGITQFVTPQNRSEFTEKNKVLIDRLPVAMRRHLLSELAKVAA